MPGADCYKTPNIFIVHSDGTRRHSSCSYEQTGNVVFFQWTTGTELQKGVPMNTDIVQGKWKQVRGAIKQVWGRATDDRSLVVSGERDALLGRIQVRAARAGLNDADWVQMRPGLARSQTQGNRSNGNYGR